jgi:hypothetical protein
MRCIEVSFVGMRFGEKKGIQDFLPQENTKIAKNAELNSG